MDLGARLNNSFGVGLRHDPDDRIEVSIVDFSGKKIVNVKILDRVLN